MDSTLQGSLIQATVTCLSVIVAVLSIIATIVITNRQTHTTISQFTTELNLTREQMKLTGYENLLGTEQRMFEVIMQNESNAKGFLRHFMLEGKNVPEEFEMVRIWIIILAQISAYENLYYRHIKGYFPSELWLQWDRSMGHSFKDDPLFRLVWNSTDFKKYLWIQFTNHVDQSYFNERREDEK